MENKHEATANQRVVHRARNSWSGFLFGVGLVAFIVSCIQLVRYNCITFYGGRSKAPRRLVGEKVDRGRIAWSGGVSAL